MSKRDHEAYRVGQFALPHPAKTSGPSGRQLADAVANAISPDEGRVIVHFDLDAFYAQVEEVRDPSLRLRPLGITQKYLIVTSNYPARAMGVSKLMGIKDAQARCPGLVLVSGEDLTPYRRASRAMLAVLARFGTVEKGGMDEAFVDVTKEARARVAHDASVGAWHGHLHLAETELIADNPHRPMDLRAVAAEAQTGAIGAHCDSAFGPMPSWQALLQAGSAIAAEARAALKAEAGYRSSAGIACNKMLAKLSSGIHKPDDQTILPPPVAAAFVAPLPLRAIPGIGYKLDAELRALGLETTEDLRRLTRAEACKRFGERIGEFLYLAARGTDPSPVKALAPPKSVTVEDSFKSCTSMVAAAHVARVLAPDLFARLTEEFEDNGRRPQSFVLKWRHASQGRGTGHGRSSASCNMPPVVRPPFGGAAQAEAIEKAAMTLLTRNTSSGFNLTLLNLGATNFVDGRLPLQSGVFRQLAPRTPSQPCTTSQPCSAPGPGSQPDKYTAMAATAARRDYGAAPAGALALSKSTERQLREGRMPAAQQWRQSVQADDLVEAWSEEDDDWGGGGRSEWDDIVQAQREDLSRSAAASLLSSRVAEISPQQRSVAMPSPVSAVSLSASAQQDKSVLAAAASKPTTACQSDSHRAEAEEAAVLSGAANSAATANLAAAAMASTPAAVPLKAATHAAGSDSEGPATAAAEMPEETEQELADRQLAQRLQAEEAVCEAERRQKSRERFLDGLSTGPSVRKPRAQRGKGPLDSFVSRCK